MTNPDPKYTNSETALGGADAIQKTSAVPGRGTEPEGMAQGESTAHPPAGAGPNYLAWGVGAIVALIVIAYLLGALG